jgi:hypothetical protein
MIRVVQNRDTDNMARSAPSILSKLQKCRDQYDERSDESKACLLDSLADARFQKVSDLIRFHEVLCFLRAYPDGPKVLRRVDALLDEFDQRYDVKKLAKQLIGTGIAGSRIDYAFYWATAEWLADRWPKALHIRWAQSFPGRHKVHDLLKTLLPYAELILLDESGYSPKQWIEQVKGSDETDATFLIRRFGKLRCSSVHREMAFEDLDIPISITPGRDTPSRTKARYAASPIVWQRTPRSRKRPVLKTEIKNAPEKVTKVSREEGRRLIDLARVSMVTRERDVDTLAYANADDILLVDSGQGLQFAWMSAVPARRHILECVYFFLAMKNGVPFGYVQAAGLFGSAEINYNVYETFRGADAGWVYGRALAAVHHLMHSDCFVLDPYQLGGEGNTDGLKTGVWWFYYKMGYRPRDPDIRQLALKEARKVKSKPGYRTPLHVLQELAEVEMYLYLGKKRDDVLSIFPLDNVGLHVTRMLAARFGADRERGIATCVKEAMQKLNVATLRDLSRDQKQAWERWAPLVGVLAGVDQWSARDKRALASLIKAKGSPHELKYLHLFDSHTGLRNAIADLACTPGYR